MPRPGACSGWSTTAPPCREDLDRCLECAHENLRPIYVSWLNQIELYISIVQREALTPNDQELSERLLAFQEHYSEIARPFEWPFTRVDLDRVIEQVAEKEPQLRLAT